MFCETEIEDTYSALCKKKNQFISALHRKRDNNLVTSHCCAYFHSIIEWFGLEGSFEDHVFNLLNFFSL